VISQEYKSIFITRVSEVRETLLPLYLLVAVCDAVAYLRAGLNRTIPIYEIFIPCYSGIIVSEAYLQATIPV